MTIAKFTLLGLFFGFAADIVGGGQADLSGFIVNPLYLDLNLLPFFQHLARVIDAASTAKFGNMDQAINAGGRG